MVLRLGKLNRIVGAGFFFTIPIIEKISATVDQRIRATAFEAEEALTADLVCIDVNAVLFWVVWDPSKACIEVENYEDAVSLSSKMALRDVIGLISLGEVASRRDEIDSKLQDILMHKTEGWGITIMSVEIKDIVIPEELQDSLSKEAQAERERNARIMLAEVEKDISDMYVEAADSYKRSDSALQLRAMNLVYESMKDHGGLVIAPTNMSEAFSNIEKAASLPQQPGK